MIELSWFCLIFLLSFPATFLFIPEGDAATKLVIWGDFNSDLITRQDTDKIATHSTGERGQNKTAVGSLYPKHGVGQSLCDDTLKLSGPLV